MKAILLGGILVLHSTFVSAILTAAALTFLPAPSMAQTSVSGNPPQTRQNINKFNHVKTGFPLSGVHVTTTCETCHIGGLFKGTPTTCAGCHTIGNRTGATPKSPRHVPTNKSCDVCHSSTSSFQVAMFKHAGIVSGCASCHNGSTALGKSAGHRLNLLRCNWTGLVLLQLYRREC